MKYKKESGFLNKTVRHFFIILFIFSCIGSWAQISRTKKSFVRLDGEWDLYFQKNPYQTFEAVDNGIPADYKSIVPGYWNKDIKNAVESGKLSEPIDPKTYGCYRYVYTGLNPQEKYALLVQDAPKTSCSIYVNRKIITFLGDPFAMLSEDYDVMSKISHSSIKPIYCEFYPDEEGHVEIVFFVSNYFYRKGGLCGTVLLGTANSLSQLNTSYLIFNTVILGCLIFICILNLVQFLINRNRIEYLYLGLLTLSFALRLFTYGYSTIGIVFPWIPPEVKVKIEYIALWLGPSVTLQMLFAMYPPRHKMVWEKILRYVILTLVTALGLTSLVLPAVYSNQLVPALQIAMGVVSLYVVIVCITNILHHKRYSLLNFLSFFIIIIGALIDIAYTKNRTLMSLSMFPFFVIIYLTIQILLIGIIQNDLYKQMQKKTEELKLYNEAYLRFVPQEFLTLLNKESIIKTNLGDFSNIEMCIMFSKMTLDCIGHEGDLQEHFVIFNEYLKRISPIITKHNGFVSKFLSGGFMALFPKSELDAVGAALEIKSCTQEMNQSSVCQEHKLHSWIGIHYGKMIIGTIGEENRLDDTVISDTVNTASRIESVCEKLKKTIIISHDLQCFAQKNVRIQLAQRGIPRFTLNQLEAIYVKGKEKPLQLYEVLELANKNGGAE